MRKRGFLCFISAILFLLPSFLWAGTATVQWQANPETDLKEYKVYRGTASRTYSAPLPIGKVTSYTFSNLAEGTTHYFSVTAVDSSGNESGFSVEASKFVTASVSDTQKPQVTITLPTTSGSYTSSTSSITLGGTATDSGGVTQVTWTKSTGGSGTATGTSNWSIPGISLVSGSNAITVTAKDAAGNLGTAVIAVTYTVPTPVDTQAPAVSISSPTTSGSYTSSTSSITLGGTATDSGGVTQVTWTKSTGGSGTATGTSNWSIPGISLVSGSNTITVTAKDAAGNLGTANITVAYSQPSAGDTQSPQVAITSPTTGGSYETSSSSVGLAGSASDNVGVKQVSWTNSRGGSGTAYGTTNWSVRRIRLYSGDNTISVTAKDAAGNQTKSVISVNYKSKWYSWFKR